MKKILLTILTITLLTTTLTGCLFMSGIGPNGPGSRSAPASPQPTARAPSSGTNTPNHETEIAGDGGQAEATHTVIGPTSIVQESPILGSLSPEERDLFLRMEQTSADNYDRNYTANERLSFSSFLFDTIRIDFDRRIIEHGYDLKYYGDTNDPLEMFENYRYLQALLLSGFWEINDNGILEYNRELFQKFIRRTGHGSLVRPDDINRYPFGIAPSQNESSKTIEPPVIDPFQFTVFRYHESGIPPFMRITAGLIVNPLSHNIFTSSLELQDTRYVVLDVTRTLPRSQEGNIFPVVYALRNFNRQVADITAEIRGTSEFIFVNPYPDELIKYFD